MSTMSSAVCGVWPTARRLVAVIERDGRTSAAASVARTTEARWGFVAWLTASGVCALVTTDVLARDELVVIAREAGLDVWLAPAALVDAVRGAAALERRAPRHTAALLARWPARVPLRQHLHHVGTAARQLRLW